MGNITNLGRYDNTGTAASPVQTRIDTLSYTYSHYKVTQVDDASGYTGAFGFQDPVKQANEYTYDGNGNELKDLNKGISSITYNLLNLPQTITKSDGTTVTYVYNAGGNKLRKLLTAGGITAITEYDNGIQYDNSISTIAFIQTEEGRARKSGSSYVYEYDLKDHLGNTRVTLMPDPADGTQQTAKIVQENDYYAFGYGIQSSQWAVSPKNEYLYNHKELQEETGLYDYGARFYDPVIGRWTSVDPLAEKGRRWSPHSYAFSDPMRFTDPDGMWPDCSTCDLLIGFAAAVIDNNTGGFLPVRQIAAHLVTDAKSFNRGQDGGDIASVIQGGAEVNGGSATASTALTVTAGSGGLTAEVSLPVAAVGGLVAAHGAVTGAHGTYSLATHKGRIPEKPNEHHSDPKFMGGDSDQNTTTMPESEHKQLHQDLNDHLVNQTDGNGNHMRPQRGNSGANIQRNFTRAERIKAMADFYLNQGKKYLQAAEDFFTQHPQK
jgi:RHS repeat-associated protein